MVFLSHSGKDKEFVTELYRLLTRDGVKCFFDIESIGWGDNWVKALERAIDECEYIVFVLSPDFLNSKWVEVERTSSIANDPSGLERKVRPLKLHACDHLPTFPRFLRQVQAIDVSTGTQFEQNYPRICRELGGVLTVEIDKTDRSKLPPVHPLPAINRMPHRSLGDGFVGRVREIWALHDSLSHDHTTVLEGVGVVAGTGGLGKTQLAIEYAHRFGSAYTGGVYWVDAEPGVIGLLTQISKAAGIDLDTRAEESKQVEQLWRGLNARNLPCLIVLDNFPETVELRPQLPTTGKVHTIVTTRRQDLGYATVRLPVLSLDEGVRLLNSGERQFGQSAAALVERLGGLPLALELSKSYLNQSKHLDIPALLADLDAEGEVDVLTEFALQYRDQLPGKHERDVVSTFQLSWNIASDPAKDLLRVMGELAAAGVPRKLLRMVLNLPEQSGIRDELNKRLNELARLSLVELDGRGDPKAHRLILAFVRHRNVTDDASPFDQCLAVLQQQIARANDNPDANTTRELESLLPHIEFLVGTGRPDPATTIDLLSWIGIHYRTTGRFTASRHVRSRALELAEQSFQAGHPSIARSQSNLAIVLKDLGELAEARDLLRAALASDEQSFQAGHPSIARRQSNLATVLQALGELAEARDLLRAALASDEQSFQAGHPSIARSQSNLATVLQDLGELAEARDLLRAALASAEQSFQAGHPSIARRQSNLALVLKDLGELAEARNLLRAALASAEQSFQAGHPSIARRQSNLALVLQDLGELAEARDLLRAALASAEQSFQAGHPSIARRQSNLALVLQDLGELAEARDLLRAALESAEQSFQAGHPSIAIRQSNLALVLQDLGELAEARDLLRVAYSASLERYGPDYPATKTIKSNLESLPDQPASEATRAAH